MFSGVLDMMQGYIFFREVNSGKTNQVADCTDLEI